MYEYVLFDLDGTITDPREAIREGVCYALENLGYVVDKDTLDLFIGPPLMESFQGFYDMPKDVAEKAVDLYRIHYRKYGVCKNDLYDGIKEVFIELKKRGKKLILATSKPEVFSIDILKQFDLLKYFDFISGATLTFERTTKSEIIKYALDNMHISNMKKVIMIGDRKYDIEGAREFGIETIAVLYGYGNINEFVEHKAKYIVKYPLDILDIIK